MWIELNIPWPTLTALSLCAIGAWFSGQLLKRYDNIWDASEKADQGMFAQLCAATARFGFSCSDSVKGKWSRFAIPWPRPHRDFTVSIRRFLVPTAFLGLLYFSGWGLWLVLTGIPRGVDPVWQAATIVAGTVGGATSVFFVLLMAARRSAWCAGCLGVHVANGLLLLVVGLAVWRMQTASMPGQIPPIGLTTVLRVVAVMIFVWVGLYLYRRGHVSMGQQLDRLQSHKATVWKLQRDPAFLLWEYDTQPIRLIPPRPGNDDASQTAVPTGPRLVVFTDFQCGGCHCTANAIHNQAAARFGERLTVDVRHFPLCSACNDTVDQNLHPDACDAAYAAEAARRQGGERAFMQMHDLLFAQRKALGEQTYRRLAEAIGLDADQLIGDMADESLRSIVASDVEVAKQLDIEGTPAVFLDGKQVTKLCQTPRFWRAVADRYAHEHTHQSLGRRAA